MTASPSMLGGFIQGTLDGIAAAMSAVFDLLEIDGRVELKAVDPAAGRAIISVVWETEQDPTGR